jgi:methenyltetrahydromethanopterin cyclohydrolase
MKPIKVYTKKFAGKLEELPYDSRCSIPRTARVMKIFSGSEDLHKDGAIGTTRGACIHDGSEYYVVEFDKQVIDLKRNVINFSSTKLDYLFIEVPGHQLMRITDNKNTI